jgi:hypothetical protein
VVTYIRDRSVVEVVIAAIALSRVWLQWPFGKSVTMGTVDKSVAEGSTGKTSKASRGWALEKGYPPPQEMFYYSHGLKLDF